MIETFPQDILTSFGRGSYDGRIYNSRFDDNTAYRSGGAISWDGVNGTMEYCNFTNNAALGTDINTVLFNLDSLSKIINGTSLPSASTDTTKIYVYIQYDGDKRANYTMYAYDNYTGWLPTGLLTSTSVVTEELSFGEEITGWSITVDSLIPIPLAVVVEHT